jgi:hypothetical protein
VAKIKRVLAKSRTDLSLPELIEIERCYAEEELMQDSEDESTRRHNVPRGGHLRHDNNSQDLRYNNTCHTGKHPNAPDFVANTGQGDQRDLKSFCRDGGG